MNGLILEFSFSKKIFQREDLNGNVRKDSGGNKRVHGRQGYGERNKSGDIILKFVLEFNPVIANAFNYQ